MFEPIDIEEQSISIDIIDSPLDTFSDSPDLILSFGNVQHYKALTERYNVAVIDDKRSAKSVATDVMTNLKHKLLAREMPANLDIADVRSLANDCEYIQAFSDLDALCDELAKIEAPKIAATVILVLHGKMTEQEYAEKSQRVGALLSEYALYFVSYQFEPKVDCEITALIGVREIR